MVKFLNHNITGLKKKNTESYWKSTKAGMLWDYCDDLRRTNKGSTVVIKSELQRGSLSIPENLHLFRGIGKRVHAKV